MKRLFALLVFCLLGTSLATAQTAVVRHNVNLRSDASTDSDIIERLKPGAQVQLIEPDQTGGYYHVTAPDGQEGWVSALSARRERLFGKFIRSRGLRFRTTGSGWISTISHDGPNDLAEQPRSRLKA